MTDADRDQFSRDMLFMASGYNAPMNDLRIELYFAALADIDIAAIKQAIVYAVNRCKFCPTVADLREAIEGSQTDRAEQGWLTWKAAAHRYGAYTSLDVADVALAETIIAVFGSWPAACALNLSDEMWAAKRKEFERVYRVMERRAVDGPRRLAGLAEIQNTQPDWQRHTPVAFIGNAPDRKQLA